MATNTFNINTKTGAMSAVSNVRATYAHTCECGQAFELTLDWPENLEVKTELLSVKNVSCPRCHSPVTLPAGIYHVEDYRLKRL
jgi:hypothetical protein